MAHLMPAASEKGAARAKWYEDAPQCPECGRHRVSVGEARIGFFGLCLTYFTACDECLPAKVAEYSREVRANLLGAEAAS
jgi:C4-type Zn-finger protein